MEAMIKEAFTHGELCAALEVSRSDFHAHRREGARPRRQQDADLSVRIAAGFADSRRTYGTRRLRVLLAWEGHACGRRRIARLMAENGLRALRKGRYRPRTTDSRHDHAIAPNRLLPTASESSSSVPLEQTWVADITYLPTGEGWLYLAAEMNLGSRRIVGWKTGSTMESALVQSAFNRAAFASPLPKLHHSDRGSQYAAAPFRSLLAAHGVTPSMSRKANCYDNAAMESFWATLKAECFPDGYPGVPPEVDPGAMRDLVWVLG